MQVVVLQANVINNSSGGKQLVFEMQTSPFPSEPIIVEVSFPKHTDLQKVESQLAEDCPFFCRTQPLSHDCLLLTLQDIADLLEIDLVNSYGATGVKILNSRLESEKPSFDLSNFSQIEKHNDIEQGSKNKDNPKKQLESEDETVAELPTPSRLERLTSLEDIVRQEEKLQAYLDVFTGDGSTSNYSACSGLLEQEAKKSETLELDTQCQILSTFTESQDIEWGPIVGGFALTALLVGGYKAISTLMNN